MVEISKKFDDAWLGLGDLSTLIVDDNPMIRRSKDDIEHPDLHLLRLLRDPKYFGTTCKLLFNIELHPIQTAILEEFWIRPFPMFIASRGFGKSFLMALYSVLRCMLVPGTKIVVVGAAFRQSKIIFEYMETLWRNSPILRSIFNGNDDGPRRDVDRCTIRLGESWTIAVPMGDGCLVSDTMITLKDGFTTLGSMFNLDYEGELDTNNDCEIWDNNKFEKSKAKRYNGFKDTIRITTKRGFSIEGTYNHKIKVLKSSEAVWKRLDQISEEDQVLVDTSERWHSGQSNVTEGDAYALGLMIGDGCWTNQYRLRYTTKDTELVAALEDGTGLSFYQCSDKIHWNHDGQDDVQDWLENWEMGVTYTKDKYLPEKILQAPQLVMSACLRGIFDTDGHVQVNTSKGGTAITVSLTNTSKELMEQIHYILLHYGIVSTLKTRIRNNKWNTVYELLINGVNTKKFYEQIGFGLARKQNKLKDAITQKKRWTSQEKYYDKVYLLDPVKSISHNKNCTYDIEVENSHQYNANGICVHNSKIRGLRAHIIIADEFASISSDIYETVVSGFAAVSANPIQNVKEEAKKKSLIEAGLWNDELEAVQIKKGNQAIISGTADYAFKHFASYWKRYKAIIESKGDKHKLEEIFKGEVPDNFSWKDYSIIRIPYELIPKGFMDDKQVSRARATIHTGIYNMEYAACFTEDSDGFFRRSLIESCVANDSNPIIINEKPIIFDSSTTGNHSLQYVYGIDPASEKDNFSIIVLELHPDHNRVVYCWTTNRGNFKDRQKTGLVKEYDFYGFCARKIRSLMKTFPPYRIGMDAQGGGVAIEEALHDPSKLEEGESVIWPIVEDKPKDTDNQSGLHILELVQFARAEWTGQANHGLRKDLEDKVLVFPRFDQLSLALALDKENQDIMEADFNNIYDNQSDCILEIEELKNELTTIVMTQTSTGSGGRDRWDTPEVKLPNGKKGKLRKDRYSALVIANMVARQLNRSIQPINYDIIGSNLRSNPKTKTGDLYKGPSWFTSSANDNIYKGIYR